MKKAIIISCYMGRLPSNINLWIESCSYNKEYDFLLVTNDEVTLEIPDNLIVLKMTLPELKEKVQELFDFKIYLDSPYKICDYKPIFGKIFKEYTSKYEFWGHCDLDMIFGKISDFYNNDIFEKYDRIGSYGHLILYRNNEKINSLYLLKGAPFTYKKVFSSQYNYGYDESYGYNIICKYNGIKWFDCAHNFCLDKKRTLPFGFAGTENFEKQIVIHKNDKLYQVYLDQNANVQCIEKIYYHFSGTKYSLDKMDKLTVFEFDDCYNYNEDIRDLLLKTFSICEKQSNRSLKIRIKHFFNMRLYQKYIFLKQKFYFFLRR